MVQVRVVLFDLDNTLSDFMLMKEQACKAAVHAMVAAGLSMPEEAAYEALMQRYYALGLESDVAFTEFLKQIDQFNHKVLAAAINAYLETKQEFVKPYSDVKLVLDELTKKGLLLAVVTDAPKTKAYQRLLAMNIDRYFAFVIGFEDTGFKKHTGLPLALAIDRLKKDVPSIANSEILMVGDSMTRDLVPAKKLGLKTALCKYGQHKSEPKTQETPDYELTVLADIIKIV